MLPPCAYCFDYEGMLLPMDFQAESQIEFSERVHRHQTQLFAYIYSLIRNLDDADDLFQSTSLVLWKKYGEFDPAKSFMAWACGIARFEASNFLRTRGRMRLYFSDDLALKLVDAQETSANVKEDERRDALAECTKHLRARDRELVDTHYGQSLRIPQIAACKGRSTHSIHNSLRRIRRALYECIQRRLALGDRL
jgi:RNA polymerase sigma-70 factor (ECF subfamily)